VQNLKSNLLLKLLVLILCFNTTFLFAESKEATSTNSTKKYSPVDMIMEHVADANEFHITTIGHKHIVFPLPCILFNYETKKFDCFLSSRFHHEHNVNGYVLKHGRVTRLDNNRFIDFSITKNVFSMFISLLFGIVLFSIAAAGYKKRSNAAPKGVQSLLEPLIMFVVDDVIKANIGKNYMKYVPYLTSVFFFILINNLIGLIPIFPFSSNLSGNIAFTFTMAFIAFLVINLNGNRNYWHHIFAMPGVPKLMLIILTPVEIMGIFLKPAVLMLRLFGNITGGHIAILSVVSLIFILGNLGQNIGGAIGGSIVAIPIVLFVNAMELLVALLQAYVFILLTSIFIGTAIEEHEHH
jgi:F-type H+-transporting ATPase subunit a